METHALPHPDAPRDPQRADRRGAPESAAPLALVVGHDRSPASDHALRIAADLARRLNAHVHVVHAVNRTDYPIDPELPDFEEQAERTLAGQRARVRAVLAGSRPGWTYHPKLGDPVDLILRTADDVDAYLIIVGTRGENLPTALSRLLDRSVSHTLIGHRLRPVLVVPSPPTRPDRDSGDARRLSE